MMESSVLSLLLVQGPAAAGQVMEKMPALKDKNYGKTRTVYVLNNTWSFQNMHRQLYDGCAGTQISP